MSFDFEEHEMSRELAAEVVDDPSMVERWLDAFGCPAEVVLEVLSLADDKAREIGPGAAQGGRQTVFSQFVIALFRERLADGGDWEVMDYKGKALLYKADRPQQLLSFASGNASTGRADQTPNFKNAKGAATAEQVRFEFDEALPFLDVPEKALWVLLHHRDEQVIRVELSRVLGMEGGFVSSWGQRIILEPVSRGPEVEVGPAFKGQEFEFDVAMNDE